MRMGSRAPAIAAIIAAATASLPVGACPGFGGDVVIRMTESQVQTALDLRFPVARSYLGRINLAYHDPEAHLTPGSDRVGVGMSLTLSLGSRDDPTTYSGRAHMMTGLAYDAEAAQLVLDRPVLDSLSLGRLSVGYLEEASALARQLVQDRLDHIPIYDLDEAGLSGRVARLVLEDVTVEDGQLVITLGRRSRDDGREALYSTSAVPGGAGQERRAPESRLFGGSRPDDPFGCLIGDDGRLFVVGQTRSPDFPRTDGPPHSGGNNLDGFLLELDETGEILFSRLFVGSKRDDALGIVRDSAGNLYIVGTTSSPDFPTTPGAYDRSYNGGNYGDAFAMKVDARGNVVWSTLLGGSGPDRSRGVLAVDAQGRLYIGGRTESPDFPTTVGVYGCRAGPPECAVRVPVTDGSAAFLARLSADGSRLESSTLYGGAGEDAFFGALTVLPADGALGGGVLGGGPTGSPDLPTTAGAYDTDYNGACDGCRIGDAFLALFSPDLDELRMATFIGGRDRDSPGNKPHIRVDGTGRIYLLGHTASTDFPVAETALQRTVRQGGNDAYVVVLSPDGSELLNSTLLGGSGDEEASGFMLRADGAVVLTGQTKSRDFPVTADAVQPEFGGGDNDIFVSVLSPDLSTLVYSTFWGGGARVNPPRDWGDANRCLALAPDGALVVIGYTSSPDFPLTTGSGPAGASDGYVLRLYPPAAETPAP
jgi:hypothetical protein